MRHSLFWEKKHLPSLLPHRPEGHGSSCVIIFLDVYLSSQRIPSYFTTLRRHSGRTMERYRSRERQKYIRRTTRRERERIDGHLLEGFGKDERAKPKAK